MTAALFASAFTQPLSCSPAGERSVLTPAAHSVSNETSRTLYLERLL